MNLYSVRLVLRAMAEIILAHNQKGDRAEAVYLPAPSPTTMRCASTGWGLQRPSVWRRETEADSASNRPPAPQLLRRQLLYL